MFFSIDVLQLRKSSTAHRQKMDECRLIVGQYVLDRRCQQMYGRRIKCNHFYHLYLGAMTDYGNAHT